MDKALINALIALALSVLMLYAWAGICYLFLRYIRPETPSTQRRFMERRHAFFTERAFREPRREVTHQVIQEAGARGWIMAGLPIATLSFGLSYAAILSSCACLFFGGLAIAYSWYGSRCLRMLGSETYERVSSSDQNG